MGSGNIILDYEDISRIMLRLTHEILAAHAQTASLALIGIQTRGVHLARRLYTNIKQINGAELPLGKMDITLYRDDWNHPGTNSLVRGTDIPFSVDGKQIILVDDVLYTGRTVRAAMDEIIDFGRPDRIELAVLVDRGHREFPIRANYIGQSVKTERIETVRVFLSELDGEDKVVRHLNNHGNNRA